MEYYEYICIENIIIMKIEKIKKLTEVLNLVNSDDKRIMNKCGVILYYTTIGLSLIADIILAYSIYTMNV